MRRIAVPGARLLKLIKYTIVLMTGVIPLMAQAMSVGEIELQSYFGQPLRAEISIPSATPDELETLRVNLAPASVFQQEGVALTEALRALQFTVEKNNKGQDVVMVSSTGNFNELATSFYVEFQWRGGKLIKGYDLLVSPPVAALISPQTELVEETVSTIARQVTPSKDAPASGALQYGPIKAGDVLSLIAQKIRPDKKIALQQMMLALYQQNPEAFEGSNINLLKRGSMLRIEDVQSILRIDARQARAQINEQLAKWQQADTSSTAGDSKGALVVDDEARQLATDSPNEPLAAQLEMKPRLQILTGEESLRLGGSMDPVEIAAVKKEVGFVTEEAEALRKENQELKARLDNLEQLVSENIKRMEAYASNRSKVSIISRNDQIYTDDLVTTDSDISFKAEETSYMSEIFGSLLLLVGLSGLAWLYISKRRHADEMGVGQNWWTDLRNRFSKKNTKTYIG